MNKIQLIDAETLYYKPLAHPRMLIDGILAAGESAFRLLLRSVGL